MKEIPPSDSSPEMQPDSSSLPDRYSRLQQKISSRPDASMSLLNDLLRNPLDAAYGSYLPPRAGTHPHPLRIFLLFILAVCLGMGTTISVRHLREPTDSRVQQNLISQARERSENVKKIQKENLDLNSAVRSFIERITSDTEEDQFALKLADSSEPVRGAGLRVTVTDGEKNADRTTLKKTVRDQDLQVIVNALWRSGAEAVSINGLRLGPHSFIRTAGSAILVNIEAIKSPYTVEAIGNSNVLATGLITGETGDYLSAARSLGRFVLDTQSSKRILMSALEDTKNRYALPLDQKG